MASFSFGAGNVAKLARIPLYLAGRLATAVMPRSSDLWVIGCGGGIGDGALAMWHRVTADSDQVVWLVGSSREEADAAALGIRTAQKNSARGFWLTARAAVIVVTHGFGDVNRYADGGAFIVQLWHGIPLKRIGLDSPATVRVAQLPGRPLLEWVIKTLYRRTQRRIALIPAASHLVRGRLESAFGLTDEQVIVTGEPRVDVLSVGTAQGRRATARLRLEDLLGPIEKTSRVVLYAPTWRDGAEDPAIPSRAQWHRILEVLSAHDAILVVRSHPLGAGTYVPPEPSDRVRVLGSNLAPDVTPLLPAMDVLITDYSSLVYDSALVPLPVVFLAPDVVEYARDRGFYGTYVDVAGDAPAANWDSASDRLDELLSDRSVYAAAAMRAKELSAKVHAYDDGMNTDRVYRAILRRVAPTNATEELE